MALKDDLKNKLPEYQRGNTQLDQLLEAVGELLDNFKQEINNHGNFSDFELIEEKNIEALAKEFDIEFPRNMSERRRRDYLREVVTLYRSKGTKRSLERVFRLIGWQVEILEYWIVNPEWYEVNGSPYTLTNEQGASFELAYDPNSTDEVYEPIEGEIKTAQERLLVNLTDPSGNNYPNRQIYGQVYGVPDDVTFMKVPYIKVRVTVEDFDLFTSNYTGEDGNTYAYDSSEEFEIYQAIQDYFLPRIIPAHVAVLSVSTPFKLDDTIQWVILDNDGNISVSPTNIDFDQATGTITRASGSWLTDGFTPEMTITVTGTTSNNTSFKLKEVTALIMTVYKNEYPVVDELTASPTIVNGNFTVTTKNGGLKYDGTATYGNYLTDPNLLGETIGGYKYDSNSEFEYYGVEEKAPQEIFVVNYGSTITPGDQGVVAIRKNTQVGITIPVDAGQTVSLYGVKTSNVERGHGVPIDFDLIGSAGSGGTINVSLNKYFAVFVNIAVAPSAGNVAMTLTLD